MMRAVIVRENNTTAAGENRLLYTRFRELNMQTSSPV